jgi:hypothetical protein
MNTPTPTPRTDAATYPADCLGKTLVTNRDCPRELERELTALATERDQLRADCENETKWAAHYLAQSIADRARAERAEAAETVALAHWNGALERAMKAEADLAKARATAELRDSLAIGQDNCDDAYDELATDCAELRADVVRLTAERDQLRAKAERFQRLQRFVDTAAAEMKVGLITFGGIAGLRAERDELSAKVERLDRAAGAIDEAFGKAEAELATERARLDSGTILLTVAGERVWHCGVDLRAAIDAGMREDAK